MPVGISGMTRVLMQSQTDSAREEAMVKLYVMLQQGMMLSRRVPQGGNDALAEILDISMPELLKFLANIILRKDKQCSEQVFPTHYCHMPFIMQTNLALKREHTIGWSAHSSSISLGQSQNKRT